MENLAQSAQERLFRLPELLFLVLSFLENIGALPSIALVCNTFREAALDIIWRQPPSLEVLLPIAQTQQATDVEQPAAIATCDWANLQSYTSRIKKLVVRTKLVSPEVSEILASAPSSVVLFPSLKYLDIRSVGLQPDTLQFLRHCSAETLYGVSFYVEAGHEVDESAQLDAMNQSCQLFVGYITPFGRSLRALRLTFAGERSHALGESFLRVMPSTFKKCSGLTHLHVAANWGILSSVASLTWLDEFTVDFTTLPRDRGVPSIPHPRAPFYVSTLCLILPLNRPLPFLPRLNVFATQSLEVQANGLVTQPRVIYETIATLLKNGLSQNLTSFHLYGSSGAFRMSGGLGLDSLAFGTFEPLLALRSLQNVVINAEHPVRTTDADLAHIAKAWPSLRRLHLSTLRFDHPPREVEEFFQPVVNRPRVATVEGLLLLRACSELERLTICLDGSVAPLVVPSPPPPSPSPSPESPSPPPSKLWELSVGYSPMPSLNAEKTAELLTTHFPNLYEVSYTSASVPEDEEGAQNGADPEALRRRRAEQAAWRFNAWGLVSTATRIAYNRRWNTEELVNAASTVGELALAASDEGANVAADTNQTEGRQTASSTPPTITTD